MEEREIFLFFSEELKKNKLITLKEECNANRWDKFFLVLHEGDLNRSTLKRFADEFLQPFFGSVPGDFKGAKPIAVKNIKEAVADYEKNLGIAPDIAVIRETKKVPEGIRAFKLQVFPKEYLPPQSCPILLHSSAFIFRIKKRRNGQVFEIERNDSSSRSKKWPGKYKLMFKYNFRILKKKYFRFYKIDGERI